MKWPAMFAAMVLASAGHATGAQPATAYGESPWASLYDDATLRYWQGRYSPNIRINFDTLLSHLSARERVVVTRSLLRIGTRDPRDPLAYYALQSPASIHLSTLSIKFLDDIAIASAWLAKHEYSIESVPYYSAVLKYRDTDRFPGHRYPPPLTALGIPDDALADAFVDDVSQKTLKGAIMFIMAHEVAHVLHEDSATGTAEARQRREAAADTFALEMFRRMGTAPAGVETLFLVAAYMDSSRGDFPNDAAWREYVTQRATHPLSGRRVIALAAGLGRRPSDFTRTEPNAEPALVRLRYMAVQLRGLGPLLDDVDLQRHAAIIGRQIPLSELRPRRPGHSWIPGSAP